MALLTKPQIVKLLTRLGELAGQKGYQVELLLMGGAVMVLKYEARLSTRDLDAVILSPSAVQNVRALIKQIASEQGLPEDWLNDAAKGYLMTTSEGEIIFSAPGIVAKTPSIAQLLAMKLSAWRDDVDIEDARRLLRELTGERNQIWQTLEPFLVPNAELKAQYAFLDLWETTHGKNRTIG